jgi:SAM-dependent methyltransferase
MAKKYIPENLDSFIDDRTALYYRSKATVLSEKYNSCRNGIEKYFPTSFAKNGKILDVGCGSGRDLNILCNQGYDAVGIEPAPELVQISQINFPNIADRILTDSLPGLKKASGTYSGILCSAVLQHIPDNLLFDTFYRFKDLLSDEGSLLISVPTQYPNVYPETHRDESDRLFKIRHPEQFIFIAERIGFHLANRWEEPDSLNRDGVAWAVLLFINKGLDKHRPLDQIESILREDTKNTTYKFALLRALGEIAQYNYNSAIWQSDGNIRIPVELVVDKWIEYYWPIISAEKTIMQGAGGQGRSDIGFRKNMSDLSSYWNKSAGGYKAFRDAYLKNEIDGTSQKILTTTKKSIREAILKGPVTYAGSNKIGGKIFEDIDKSISMSASLWREFALMGRWFQDSILMRWAEFTKNLKSQTQEIRIEYILEILLSPVEARRDVSNARTAYDKFRSESSLECVWTGTDLSKRKDYVIDHAIPFSLWYNNDLWNLFPASKTANHAKLDRLPTKQLIENRKLCIYRYWEFMYEQYPTRFLSETKIFTGAVIESATDNELEKLFNTFKEAVEVTAIRRCVARWSA